MPTSAMWQRVAARQKRELPSLVTTHEPAALGHDEVGAGHARVGRQVLVPQELARPPRDDLGLVVVGAEAVLLEDSPRSRGGSCG